MAVLESVSTKTVLKHQKKICSKISKTLDVNSLYLSTKERIEMLDLCFILLDYDDFMDIDLVDNDNHITIDFNNMMSSQFF